MNWMLTWLAFGVVIMLLGWGMLARGRIYQFPFLVGAIAFSFVLPQLPGLASEPFLPDGGFVRTVAFTILCLGMCWLGWRPGTPPISLFNWSFDERRMLMVASLFSVVGAYFYFQFSRLPPELVVGQRMSGAPVMYLFFSRFLSYGMAIATLCLVGRFSWRALAVVVFDGIFYVDSIVITGKRGETVELLLIFGLSLWFIRRWALPRALGLAGVVLGTLLMASTNDYRQVTRENAPAWSVVAHINVMENFDNLVQSGGLEMHNAILRMAHAAKTMEFDYGKVHWNGLVYNYVPAQIFGQKFKSSLILPLPIIARNYTPKYGTTETGMADAFQSFWYFGAIKFLFLSYVLCRLWRAAEDGNTSAQILYMFSIVPGMHAISHQTDWVLSVWVHMAIFLLPALYLAKCSTLRQPAELSPGNSKHTFA